MATAAQSWRDSGHIYHAGAALPNPPEDIVSALDIADSESKALDVRARAPAPADQASTAVHSHRSAQLAWIGSEAEQSS